MTDTRPLSVDKSYLDSEHTAKAYVETNKSQEEADGDSSKYNEPGNLEDPIDHHRKQKRGLKPRSMRNRKRPKSELHGVESDFSCQTNVRRLELDGKPLASLKFQNAQWLRVVEPYPYTFSTFAKKRWEGKTILEVYSSEFGSYPKSYYEAAIMQGRILVSDRQVHPSYPVKDGDVLSHTVHRHEPGVAVQSSEAPYVTVIEETEDVLVVDKPGTLPVHPCGGYHIQSLTGILEGHYRRKLYSIHRIDRLTSGLIILGKSSAVAKAWGTSIMKRDCQKVYLARVRGRFPFNCPIGLSRLISSQSVIPWNGDWYEEDEKDANARKQAAGAVKHASDVSYLRKKYARVFWITDVHHNLVDEHSVNLENVFNTQYPVKDWVQSIVDQNEDAITSKKSQYWFHLACPTRIAQHKDGICEAGSFEDLSDELYKKTVKPAASSFGVISYDSATDTTLLICRPHTGRTHQLRLHLQYLGHPIANDPNYGGELWFSNQEGKKAALMAQNRLSLIEGNNDIHSSSASTFGAAIDVPATEDEIYKSVSITSQEGNESVKDFVRRTCVWCARSRAVGSEDRVVLEFMIRSPGIWLHALRYSFSLSMENTDDTSRVIKTFCAPLPAWHDI